MGRVFQYSEIESGLVPNIADFRAAATAFCEQTTLAIEQGHVDGAFIFGSVAGLLNADPNVAPNQRSDMDSFVVISNYESASLETLKAIARAVYESSGKKIAAQPIVYPRAQLENGHIPGMHEMDPMFGIDLTGPGRFVIGADPAEYTRFPFSAAFNHFNAFIAQKRRKLHNGLAQEPESEIGVRTVQRFLELPLSVGRKAIQALILDGQYDSEGFWAANKSHVVRAASEELFLGDEFPVTIMQRIMGYDRDYSSLLKDANVGKVDEKEYIAALRALADYTSGITWLNYVHQALSARLRTPSLSETAPVS